MWFAFIVLRRNSLVLTTPTTGAITDKLIRPESSQECYCGACGAESCAFTWKGERFLGLDGVVSLGIRYGEIGTWKKQLVELRLFGSREYVP